MSEKFTYAKVGVDVNEVSKIHSIIWDHIKKTFKFRERKIGAPLNIIGHFAGLIEIGNNKILSLHVDGVGTKILVAQLIKKFDTIGIDLVAMCVNDTICVGAEPISLIDYLAVQKPDRQLTEELMKGLVKGAEIAGISIVGGETAVIPEMIRGEIEKKGFDLAGMCVGIIERDKIITGEKIQPNDVVLGLSSSGIHSNGVTLARKVLLESAKLKLDEKLPDSNRTVGEELLEPTQIYAKPVLDIIKNCEVRGLAHITGGGFLKLKRIGKIPKIGFVLDNLPEPQLIFKAIQKFGRISNQEMYRTFNMGTGFCIVLSKNEVDKARRIIEKYNIRSSVIGRAVADPQSKLEIKPVGVIL